MGIKQHFTVTVLAASMALVGCGGSSDFDTGNNGPSTGSNVPSSGSFFNANDGVNFATKLGGKLSGVTTNAVDSTSQGLSNSAQNDDPTSGVYNDSNSVEQCDSGSVSYSFATDAADNLENASIVYNNCVLGGQTTTGTITMNATNSGPSESLTIAFGDFGNTGADGDSYIDGAVTMSFSDNGDASINGTSLTMTADGETTTFTNFALNTATDPNGTDVSVDGQATIASSVDGTITFVINPALVGPADGNPVVGQMLMTHEDGSSLLINADTGNPATYNYTVNGNGAITTGTANWDDAGLIAPRLAKR